MRASWRTWSCRGRCCAPSTLFYTSSCNTKAMRVTTTTRSTPTSTRYSLSAPAFLSCFPLKTVQTEDLPSTQVLLRRTGIPISLSVLYMTLARRLGVQLEPVNFPNHFLLRWSQRPRGYDAKTVLAVSVDCFCPLQLVLTQLSSQIQ